MMVKCPLRQIEKRSWVDIGSLVNLASHTEAVNRVDQEVMVHGFQTCLKRKRCVGRA